MIDAETRIMASIIAAGIAHNHAMDDVGLAQRALHIAMEIDVQADAIEAAAPKASPTQTAPPPPTSE